MSEYVRCVVTGEENAPGAAEACADVVYAIKLRSKYLYIPPNQVVASTAASGGQHLEKPAADAFSYECENGVFTVQELVADSTAENSTGKILPPALFHEFCQDEAKLRNISTSGTVKSFCRRELGLLARSFSIHKLLNSQSREQRQVQQSKGDFYRLAKVDTHVHLAAAMTANHLLDFIQRKYREHGDEIVLVDRKTKEGLTLKQVFAKSGIHSADAMTVDSLDVQAEENLFDRFDHFNAKYNPFGNSDLRTVFLKSSNHLNGKYFAELTKEILDRDEHTAIFTEYRVSIYGTNKKEWTDLANWVVDNQLFSKNNRWMIQCPRVFNVFKKLGFVETFQDLLDNVFQPLFEVTINPAANPKLAEFLTHTSGFDSVDDESKLEINLDTCPPPPKFGKDVPKEKTTDSDNPPYAYWCYYMHANLYVLNTLRSKLGLNTFKFRPHCGESGSPLHLNTAFLTADSVNHGIQLSNTPVLCYLYYLCQVGCAVSPLSNNALFVPYKDNPFDLLFSMGLNVSLSTDDPMQFHKTEEPLLEEYQVAKQLYKYSNIDLCEIARNSCLQGGFSDATKAKQLGTSLWNLFPFPRSNNPDVTNIPDIRCRYRYETLMDRLFSILRTLNLEQIELPGLPHVKPTLKDALAMHMDSVEKTETAFGAKIMKHVAKRVITDVKKKKSLEGEDQSPTGIENRLSSVFSVGTANTDAQKLDEIRLMRKRAQEYKELAALATKEKHYSRIHVSPDSKQLFTETELMQRKVICRALLHLIALRGKYCFRSKLYETTGGAKKIRTLVSGVTKNLEDQSPKEQEQTSKYAVKIADTTSNSAPPTQEPGSMKNLKFSFPKGILTLTGGSSSSSQIMTKNLKVPSFEEFLSDLATTSKIVQAAAVRSFCYQRLELLERLFDLHMFLNHELEQDSAEMTKQDFYSIGKVDTQVKLACAMTARELLEFTKKKWQDAGHPSTLREEFAHAGIEKEEQMTVDALQVQADESLFQNFELFQQKKNVYGSRRLRDRFLKPVLMKTPSATSTSKSDGVGEMNKQDFFAEILKSVVLTRGNSNSDEREDNERLRSTTSATANKAATTPSSPVKRRLVSNAALHKAHKQTYSEFRITVTGASKQEWTSVAQWVQKNFPTHKGEAAGAAASRKNAKFLVQIPRSFQVCNSFQQWLGNLFQPLIAVTLNPDSDPALYDFLLYHVSGFDSVGEESMSTTFAAGPSDPAKLTKKTHKHVNYRYYLYFLYANLSILSKIRESFGLNSLAFRPHCGMTGSVDHLACGYLLANGISHGLTLKSSPPLAYVYYLSQIGIALSPLSNNALFQRLPNSPFYDFFRWGLNVSLSTDMPLLFHATDHPLLEEYTIAQQYWKMSLTDICEIAQNSVLQSGLDPQVKEQLLGPNCVYKSWKHKSKYWNHSDKSNVTDIRVSYRRRCYDLEMDQLKFHGVVEKGDVHSRLDEHPDDPAVWPKLSKAAADCGEELQLLAGIDGDGADFTRFVGAGMDSSAELPHSSSAFFMGGGKKSGSGASSGFCAVM
ncbi:unnamed protein product [Amoebophrya sp. A120]|nr:unnamed protein product [Amoebophrya sp. A120]|eukprot:GSA120T00020798001.1